MTKIYTTKIRSYTVVSHTDAHSLPPSFSLFLPLSLSLSLPPSLPPSLSLSLCIEEELKERIQAREKMISAMKLEIEQLREALQEKAGQ